VVSYHGLDFSFLKESFEIKATFCIIVLWFYGKTIIWHYLFDLFHTRKDLLDVVHFLQL